MVPRALAIWIILICVANLTWIRLNAAPPRSWDDAEYLVESVVTYNALAAGRIGEFARLASRPARGVHPPMVKLLPIPMYVLLGPGMRSALYAYTCLIPVFCVYLFLFAREVTRDERTGVLAVVITCCFPLTFGLWRMVMAEFGLAVAVVASQYHLLRCAERDSRWHIHAAAAGAFMGWGLLWKVSLPVFAIGPLSYLLVRYAMLRNAPERPHPAAFSVIAATTLLVSAPFYVLRFRPLWEFGVFNASSSSALERFSLGPVFSPVTIARYWAALVTSGCSTYFLLCGILALWQIARRTWPLPRSKTVLLAVSGLTPVLFFTLQFLKEPRHAFPALATFGVLCAALADGMLARCAPRQRLAILTAGLAFPLYQFVYLSFDSPWLPPRDIHLAGLPLLVADRDSLFVRPASATRWPVDAAVDIIHANRPDAPDRPIRVRMAGHIPQFDGPGLSYESALRHGDQLEYNLIGDRSLHSRWWDFVVVLTGPLRDSIEYREPLLGALLEARRLPFVPVGSVALPGGRAAHIYRRAFTPALETIGLNANLLALSDHQGNDLFSLSRSEWNLPGGQRRVAPVTGVGSVEFQYVYVPRAARSLRWEMARRPGRACDGASYVVRVFDLTSRRGPKQERTQAFSLGAQQDRQSASLDVSQFRGQIVTIQLALNASDATQEPCLGVTTLMLQASGDAEQPSDSAPASVRHSDAHLTPGGGA
jgi:hypothetical protein